jgi:hypothetical protein
VDSYSGMQRRFAEWCQSFCFSVFPAAPFVVALYVRHLAIEKKYSRNSIHVVLSAISSMYSFSEVNPVHSRVVIAARHAANKVCRPALSRKPLERSHLLVMNQYVLSQLRSLSPYSVRARQLVRDYTWILLSFLAFLRESEGAALLDSHVVVEVLPGPNPISVVYLMLESEKTNPQNRLAVQDRHIRGSVVVLSASPDCDALCPLYWVDKWRSIRVAGSKFFFNDARKDLYAKGLKGATLNFLVKQMLSVSGFDPSGFGGHSPRAGGATQAIRDGIDLRLVKRHGRWKSDAVYLYIHDNLQQRLSVSLSLSSSHH